MHLDVMQSTGTKGEAVTQVKKKRKYIFRCHTINRNRMLDSVWPFKRYHLQLLTPF